MSSHLSSLQHPFVKYLVRLRKEKDFRRKEKKVLVMGHKIIKELLANNTPCETVFCLEGQQPPNFANIFFVTKEVLDKITGIKSQEPWIALIPMPSFQDLSNKSHILILDRIADPGNLGTLLRTALALGWDGVFLLEGSCDPFNDKALRAAKGATFRIPLAEGKIEDLLSLIPSVQIFVADTSGLTLSQTIPIPPIGLVLGKESSGPQEHLFSLGQKITIPMSGSMESLNVASAGAILLHALKEQPNKGPS